MFRRVAACAALLAVHGCGPLYYTSEPIEAWVVDADTGKPIEGAIVVASWQLLSGSLDTGGGRFHQLEVKETVTDKDGRFHFPGFTKINFRLQRLEEGAPRVLVFKPESRQIAVYRFGSDASSWGAPPIDLKHLRLPSAPEAELYVRQLNSASSFLMDLMIGGNLGHAPKLIHALACENRRVIRDSGGRRSIDVPGSDGNQVCEG